MDYRGDGVDGHVDLSPRKLFGNKPEDEGSDTDFQERAVESEPETEGDTDASQTPKRPMIKGM